jgi:hypothetical protein
MKTKSKSPAVSTHELAELARVNKLLTAMAKDAPASQKRLNEILSFTRKLSASATLAQTCRA